MSATNTNAGKYAQQREATMQAIAREVLGIETLETSNSDQLDFNDLSVGLIRKALRNAYIAGYAAGIRVMEDEFAGSR